MIKIITGDHSERFTFAKEQDIRTLTAIPCIFYGKGIKNAWFNNSAACHIQIAGTIAEMIAPTGFRYMALMPNLFNEHSVFNYRLSADSEEIDLLNKNENMRIKADTAKNIAAWRILKGDKF